MSILGNAGDVMDTEQNVRPLSAGAGGTETTASKPAKRLRVLVVEDDRDTALSYDMLLGLWGHQVETWDTGRNVVEVARGYRPDVVLLDIGLPCVDGFQVARLFREQPDLRPATLIGVSGFADADHRRRSFEAGLHFYLVKPVEPRALQGILAALAEQKR
jgi:CheY-like chemotaxis protein